MGGCLPEKYLDLPMDYEALGKAGSILGSGGLVVMDEDTCMVDIARFSWNSRRMNPAVNAPPVASALAESSRSSPGSAKEKAVPMTLTPYDIYAKKLMRTVSVVWEKEPPTQLRVLWNTSWTNTKPTSTKNVAQRRSVKA